VPEARLLSDFDRAPDDLEQWVLKPLFSFSGTGVKVDVSPEDLAAVPESERASTLLMRKVDYTPVVETADGGRSRVEVRVMFVWRDGRPLPVTTLARLSRGKMMGVKFNKDKTWVGSTSCLWPAPRDAPVLTGVARICPFRRASGKAGSRHDEADLRLGAQPMRFAAAVTIAPERASKGPV